MQIKKLNFVSIPFGSLIFTNFLYWRISQDFSRLIHPAPSGEGWELRDDCSITNNYRSKMSIYILNCFKLYSSHDNIICGVTACRAHAALQEFRGKSRFILWTGWRAMALLADCQNMPRSCFCMVLVTRGSGSTGSTIHSFLINTRVIC